MSKHSVFVEWLTVDKTALVVNKEMPAVSQSQRRVFETTATTNKIVTIEGTVKSLAPSKLFSCCENSSPPNKKNAERQEIISIGVLLMLVGFVGTFVSAFFYNVVAISLGNGDLRVVSSLCAMVSVVLFVFGAVSVVVAVFLLKESPQVSVEEL